MNKLSGLTGLTSAELGYVDGVTSSIQTQLDDRYTKDEADARFADISLVPTQVVTSQVVQSVAHLEIL